MQMTEKVLQAVNRAGKQIQVLLELKESVMALAEEIKNQEGHNILQIIKGELPDYNFKDFEDDF